MIDSRIQLDHSHCRYLGHPGFSGRYRFRKFLDHFIELPKGLGLEELNRLGWITPRLRVALPASFFTDWKDFPSYVRSGTRQEHQWAAQLWALSALSTRVAVYRDRPEQDTWYVHPLDDRDSYVSRAARSNCLTLDDPLPAPVDHPEWGDPIPTWIDFYGYWQVYELSEILRVARLPFSFYFGRDNAERMIEGIEGELNAEVRLASNRVEKVRQRWLERERIFDCVSRYRTLRGLWLERQKDLSTTDLAYRLDERREAAKRLFDDRDLTEEELRLELRDRLLPLWSSGLESRLKMLLQQDIALGLNFLLDGTGRSIDWDDPFWNGEDLSGDRTRLQEALPYEVFSARDLFPHQAMLYLQRYNEVVAKRRIELDQLGRWAKAWSDESSSFSRFMVSFTQMHAHYSDEINHDNLVGLRSSIPLAFLRLCALNVERLVAEVVGRGEKKPGKFYAQVVEFAKLTAKKYGFEKISLVPKDLQKLADLHELPKTKENPFKVAGNGREGPEDFFVRILVNFAVMRNYAAHHDCIDHEMFSERWVWHGIEAIVVVAVVGMTIRGPVLRRMG